MRSKNLAVLFLLLAFSKVSIFCHTGYSKVYVFAFSKVSVFKLRFQKSPFSRWSSVSARHKQILFYPFSFEYRAVFRLTLKVSMRISYLASVFGIGSVNKRTSGLQHILLGANSSLGTLMTLWEAVKNWHVYSQI